MPSFAFIVACTSMSLRTPKPSAFNASVTRVTVIAKSRLFGLQLKP
ncbi:MAG: hypothetical protein ABIR94_12115 [Rubrivivax sp.]